MENPIYIALSRQDALRRQMDVVANNLANMMTPAYKNQRMMFLEYLAKPAATPVEKVSMVQDYGVLRNTAVGPISSTGNPLDVALQGDGYLTVETRDGQRFTRNGRLQLDLDRQIVDTNGLPVLNEQDLPMTVPQNSGPITITADGTVSSDQGQIGRIKLVRFEREQFMTELGGGIFTTDEPPLPAPGTKVVQGAVEESNVQSVVEMTQMIEISRQYAVNQKMIEAEHERQRNAITKLSRLS
ncbi:flagellar basal-body rod protein FlgF [Skermanella mucosa]|uniref:flagellar basal-body rod protein FlgF n=1 Tax=Skermanella mucosa TaxID=1789672 RepID=UPI00192B2EC5|nr:flagellar basal-body rod protein FlgF [Skermanella mucosa]UEM20194.1 flagellar basal-body rod protein FlgF [Skermanella mucosa]